jgi:formamidopyrimidine-DNA glycosylase
MPELPDLAIYIEALEARIEGRTATRLRRIGKRIAIGLDNDLWLVIHLMIAGRLHWYQKDRRGRVPAPLLQLDFDNGVLTRSDDPERHRQ